MRKRRLNIFKKRKNKEALEIDITSLLDILVILLVFLLKSYNASDLTVDIVSGLELPSSESTKLGNHAIIVQVNKYREIFVNNTKVEDASFDNSKINQLYDALQSYKEKEESNKDRTPASKTQVNIVLDQSHPYEVLRKVMHTSSLAGYSKFKFIVQGMAQ